MDEYGFSLNKINISNVEDIHRRQSRLEELRIIEIQEMAYEAAQASLELYRQDMSVSEILTFFSETISSPSISPHGNALNINLGRLTSFSSSQAALDRSVFAELYLEELRARLPRVTERDFLPENDSPKTFVYVKNALADEAYDVFAEGFSDPRVKYAPTLREAVKLVLGGEVTYCLLPLEESGGERLHAASELIFKYDLKINSVTPVFGIDGTADMKYSLVSKGFSIPSIYEDDDLYLEIKVKCESTNTLSELLLAAEHYGEDIYRINSTVFNTEEGDEPYYSLVFRSKTGDFTKLLTYLTLFAGNYTPVGIYKNLE